MRPPDDSGHRLDLSVLLFLGTLCVLVTPVFRILLADYAPWYAPYLFWLLVIACTGWIQARRRDRGL